MKGVETNGFVKLKAILLAFTARVMMDVAIEIAVAKLMIEACTQNKLMPYKIYFLGRREDAFACIY